MATDPHAVLGVEPGASPGELVASYRRLARRWHPDRNASHEAVLRMVEINAAYELLRSEAWQGRARGAAPPTACVARPAAGEWLGESLRRALGPELLAALRRGEDVRLVTPTSVWSSPEALLAVTDRRLLWLLDDAVTARVRFLSFDAVTRVETRLSWPRRRTASLRVTRRNGRRPLSFGDLRPETARSIAAALAPAA
jgi:hypothetical protein